jgi:4'-phosphopantetheinyl transferase
MQPFSSSNQLSRSSNLGHVFQWQSRESTDVPPLAENELHLWKFNLTLSDSETECALQFLNDAQRNKYERRSTAKLKESYLAGRFHLMHLLAAYNDTVPSRVRLNYSRLQKPSLTPNLENFEFNYTDTHADSRAIGLFAITKTNAVGIDIEAISRRSNFTAIANKRFSDDELGFVKDEHGSVDPARFLSIWTRKEAYGKATGMGINFRMRDMNLASSGAFDLNFLADQPEQPPFRLHQFQVGKRFIAAVVHQSHQPLEIKAFKSANHIP